MVRAKLIFFISFFLLISILSYNAFAKIYIDITSPFAQQIPIGLTAPAVNPPSYENKIAARKILKFLQSDLEFMGYFSVYDMTADQQIGKLDYLVECKFSRLSDKIELTLLLRDASDNSLLIGRRYTCNQRALRKAVHRFSNEIVKEITGKDGVTLSRILFVSASKTREIYSADFDGQNIKQETRFHSIVMSPRYSPTGQYIAFVSFHAGRPMLYLKDLRTGKFSRLAKFRGVNMSPGWHPSGDKLVVTLSKSGNPDLYLIDLSGRILRRLTFSSAIDCSPSFSPDGKKLVFISDRSGSPQLFIMDLTTSSIKRLTYRGSYNTDPQWSPNGDKIVYVGRTSGRFQIFVINSSGGDPIQLTFEGSNENPSWSPDGRQILFSSTRLDGDKHIYVMDANGQRQRLLLRFGKRDYFPFWGPNSFK